ncbi:hypothetical protein P7K49_032526, partial [Saguinus oedipus]
GSVSPRFGEDDATPGRGAGATRTRLGPSVQSRERVSVGPDLTWSDTREGSELPSRLRRGGDSDPGVGASRGPAARGAGGRRLAERRGRRPVPANVPRQSARPASNPPGPVPSPPPPPQPGTRLPARPLRAPGPRPAPTPVRPPAPFPRPVDSTAGPAPTPARLPGPQLFPFPCPCPPRVPPTPTRGPRGRANAFYRVFRCYFT